MTESTGICTATTSMGKPCRNRAVTDGLCAVHSGELSKKGVEARRAGKRNKRSWGDKSRTLRDAILRRIDSDPDAAAERLMGTSVGMAAAMAELRSAGGGVTVVTLRSAFDLPRALHIVAAHYGLTVTALLELLPVEANVDGDRRSPVPVEYPTVEKLPTLPCPRARDAR